LGKDNFVSSVIYIVNY